MSGWGGIPWGGGPWGGGLFGPLIPLSVQSAVAVSTNKVRVTLTTTPLALSSTGAGDALNPATWGVVRLDTLFPFTVLSVSLVTATQFDVTVLEAFGSSLVTHEISAPALLRFDGAAIVPPTSAEFWGLLASAVATPAALAASRRFAQTDIANPPFPAGINPGGTLVITEAGDYDMVSGAELVRKLLIRRIFTPRGGFFHLPDYGLGIAAKEPIPLSDLLKLKAEIERQARLEPEVSAASATISFVDDTLTITVKATIIPTGDQIEIVGTLPQAAVVL